MGTIWQLGGYDAATGQELPSNKFPDSGRWVGVERPRPRNTHLCGDHLDQVKEQLSRTSFAPPKLVLSDRIRPVTDLSEIEGIFTRIEPDDISLEGYQSHAAIKAPMAA